MQPTDTTSHGRPSALSRDGADEALLGERLLGYRSVLIGYSGGVDSTYLVAVALEALGRDRVLAVTGRSASVADAQAAAAREFATRSGLPWLEVDTDELDDPRYAANPTNRCYFCKHELWSKLVPLARARGYAEVLDGTNADDLTDHRPGARAALEQGIRSPLADVGLTKREVRDRSRLRGLPTWDAPSAPCLASRLPYGSPVTPTRLRRVEAAERALRALGVVGDLRVRDYGDAARVEIEPAMVAAWLRQPARGRVVAALQGAGYRRVAIDLAGFRSGSLNVLAGIDAA